MINELTKEGDNGQRLQTNQDAIKALIGLPELLMRVMQARPVVSNAGLGRKSIAAVRGGVLYRTVEDEHLPHSLLHAPTCAT